MATYKHLRSSTANKRPTTSIADGQLAINSNAASAGLFFKDSTGATIIKVGPVHVGTTAPNATPGAGGSSGNSTGEVWLDTSLTPVGVKIWNGSAWVNGTPIGSTTVQGLLELATDVETQAGSDAARAVTPASLQSKVSDSTSTTSSTTIASSTAVKSAFDLANAALPKSGGTVTGNLEIGTAGSLTFEGSVADGFETTIAVTNPTADRTITLPDTTGTVVTTGDTGTVTSTMLLDGTIVNADVNASAAIAGTKISPDFGSQTVQTTGIFSHALGSAAAPTITFTGDTNTGIYSPGADQVAISSSGVQRLLIDASGNVGVGVASPGYRLDLANGNVSGAKLFKFTGATAGGSLFGYSDAGGVGITRTDPYNTMLYLDTSNNVLFFTGSTERMRLDASGRLGLGTSAPNSILSVSSGLKATNNNYLFLETTDAFNKLQLKTNNVANTAWSIQSEEAGIAFRALALNPLGGNVGIGTTSPATLLHLSSATGSAAPSPTELRIATTTVASDWSVTNPWGRISFCNEDGSGSGPKIHAAIDATALTTVGGTSDLVFSTNNNLSNTLEARMVIKGDSTTAGARVGIGVTTPGGALDIKAVATISPLVVQGPSSEFARIDSSGRLLVGTTLARNFNNGVTTPRLQLEGLDVSQSTFGLARNSANTGGPVIAYGKSRGTVAGSMTVVVAGDDLGRIQFQGADGTQLQQAAEISAHVDGTPGANDMPGRLVLSTTADGASSPTERMRITSAGLVGIGTVSPAANLHVADAAGGRIRVGGAVNAGIEFNGTDTRIDIPAANTLAVYTNSLERARIDSSGRLLVGTSTARLFDAAGRNSSLQLEATTIGGSTIAATCNVNTVSGSRLTLAKTRGTAIGAVTIVQSGDSVGEIAFEGADGVNTVPAAQIKAEVDGTPGTNDMPGRLVFSTTADGASSPTERMRITNAGLHYFMANGNDTTRIQNTAAAGTATSFLAAYHSSTAGTVNTGTLSLNITTNGNITNTNNSYGAISDIKLKENIVDASSQWDDLKALQVRNYNFKEGQTHTQIGLVAQEVELVSPGLVSESPDRDAEGNDLGTVTKSVNYSVLYMKAVKALQEAMERIETLEAKVAALEAV
jgi:hypothetical protein